MVTPLCCLVCALATAQAGGPSQWLILPRLERGQELVYRGSYTEEAAGRGIQYSRSYRLETRIFVLRTPPQGLGVALYTVLTLPHLPTEQAPDAVPCSGRLELAHVDLQSQVTPEARTSFAVPLDGPATIECGAFISAPGGRIDAAGWETDRKR